MRPILALAPLAVLALAAGCSILPVVPEGYVEAPPPKPDPNVQISEPGSGLTLLGVPLSLLTASEEEWFGVTLVDLGALPPAWRQPYAPSGGLMVTRLRRASPLAVEGLRPYDVIVAIDGKPAGDPVRAVRALGTRSARLTVALPEGGTRTIEARARRKINDLKEFHAIFLTQWKDAPLGASFGFGPLDAIFGYHRTTKVNDLDRQAFRATRWGVLWGLVSYFGETDVRTEKGKRTLRLFWLIPVRVGS